MPHFPWTEILKDRWFNFFLLHVSIRSKIDRPSLLSNQMRNNNVGLKRFRGLDKAADGSSYLK